MIAAHRSWLIVGAGPNRIRRAEDAEGALRRHLAKVEAARPEWPEQGACIVEVWEVRPPMPRLADVFEVRKSGPQSWPADKEYRPWHPILVLPSWVLASGVRVAARPHEQGVWRSSVGLSGPILALPVAEAFKLSSALRYMGRDLRDRRFLREADRLRWAVLRRIRRLAVGRELIIPVSAEARP